jgi:hypothetical protein
MMKFWISKAEVLRFRTKAGNWYLVPTMQKSLNFHHQVKL